MSTTSSSDIIKVIGLTSLGLHTGQLATNVLSTNRILKYLLDKNSNPSTLNEVHEFLKTILNGNGFVSTTLGLISTIAFLLAYFDAPNNSNNPYLIHSALVFPVSGLIYTLLNRGKLAKFYKLNTSLPFTKKQTHRTGGFDEEKIETENSVTENERAYHLNKQVTGELLQALHSSGKFITFLSISGFILAVAGVTGAAGETSNVKGSYFN